MPPKKAKKEKKNKKTPKIVIDDVDTSVLNRTKLEEFCVNVSNEFEKEKQHSEALRLERNKLVNMVAISREQLTHLREINREYNNELRDAEDEHRVKMTFDRQKVTHLKNEMENGSLNHKLETMKILSDEREIHKEMTKEIISDINSLKYSANKMEIYLSHTKEQMEKEHAENIYKIRNEQQNTDILTELKRDKTLLEISTELKIAFAANYKTLELLKNKDYDNFLDDNSKRATQLKHYYNRIVSHNQEVIQYLKNKIDELKESMGNIDKQYLEVKKENLMLNDEINRLSKETFVLQERLSSSDKNKNDLKYTKNKLQQQQKLLTDLKVECNVLDLISEEQANIKKEEREILSKDAFTLCAKAIKIVLVLEFYTVHMYNSLNEINTHLSLLKSILEKKGKWNPLLKYVSEFQDTSMDLINYEITQISDERHNLFRRYRNILKKFNVPPENTGFELLSFQEILNKIDNPIMMVEDKHMPLRDMHIDTLFEL